MSRQTSRPNCFAAGLRSWLPISGIVVSSLFLIGCSERRSVAPTTTEDAATEELTPSRDIVSPEETTPANAE
jgi:hypothetical protein